MMNATPIPASADADNPVYQQRPSLDEVIQFVRTFSGERRMALHAETRLEEDMGITGDDGAELLEEAENTFGVALHTEEDGFRALFELRENEYLFSSEGLDLLGLGRLCRWIRDIPEPVITDLTIGRLHQILVKAYRNSQKYREK